MAKRARSFTARGTCGELAVRATTAIDFLSRSGARRVARGKIEPMAARFRLGDEAAVLMRAHVGFLPFQLEGKWSKLMAPKKVL